MNKILTIVICSFLILTMFTSITNAEDNYWTGYDDEFGWSRYNFGSIMAADSNCNQLNEFYSGDQVNLLMNKLATGSHFWTIKCNEQIVASGSFFADYAPYNLCINATIANNDCEVFDIQVMDSMWDNPSANYTVIKNDVQVIPEFSLTIGVMTVIFALVVFFLIRKN